MKAATGPLKRGSFTDDLLQTRLARKARLAIKENPEHFIAEASRIIREQKSTIIIEKLEYSALDECYDIEIFTANQSRQDLKNASEKLEKHVYDYVVTESKIEKSFVQELDNSQEVVVYAKLPRGFLIPTPVGDYNPDWAISFKEGSVRHIYFIAETTN